jgi:hypothetical protein
MPSLPRAPLEIINEALDVLNEHLALRVVEGPRTHTALVADALGDPEVPRALGTYLVGVVAGAVDEDARLSQELLARTPDSRAEVRRHLLRLLGNDNQFVDEAARIFRDTTRNPWIAEIIAHALLVLRQRQETPCLEGDIAALKQPHADPKRHGLDVIAIYADDRQLAALAIGEAKASRQYGAARLNDSASFFREIDRGGRGVEIRAEVHALKHVLSAELRATLADGFWRSRCCYLPVIVHCDPINEAIDHEGLSRLRPPAASRRLLALRLEDFHGFFDAVADAARDALDAVLADV